MYKKLHAYSILYLVYKQVPLTKNNKHTDVVLEAEYIRKVFPTLQDSQGRIEKTQFVKIMTELNRGAASPSGLPSFLKEDLVWHHYYFYLHIFQFEPSDFDDYWDDLTEKNNGEKNIKL